MKKTYLPAFLTSLAIVVLASVFLFNANDFKYSVSAAASHLVLSEIQVGGTTTTDEFVEIYNPTGDAVNLSNWKLTKKTASGATEDNLVSTMSGTIQPHGYFLVAAQNYDGSVSADLTYATSSGTIAANNTVLLYDNIGSVIDKVGMGTATDKEASSAANPGTNDSIERKANTTSTEESMTPSGVDEFLGNGEDTDNNQNDFFEREEPDPQNATSAVEPALVATASPTASPTNSPTSIPTATASPTLTPSPTASPTGSPSPTASPTSTALPTATSTPTLSPTVSPTPTLAPTLAPTVSPTVTSSPTVSPTVTASPTATATVSPSPSATAFPTAIASPTVTASPTASPTIVSSPTSSPTTSASPSASPTTLASATPSSLPDFPPSFPRFNFACRVTYKTLNFGFFNLTLPQIRCGFGL